MRSFYFTYFALFGIYIPYFTLYYESLGLTPIQIGLLGSIVPLMRPLVAWVWTYPADRLGRRHEAAVLSCALTAVAFALYLIPEGFTGLVLATFALSLVHAPSLAFAEAATLDHSRRTGTPYGRVRVWGSIGFVLASFAFGAVVDRAPIRTALHAALLFSVLNAAASLMLPRPPAAPAESRTSLKGFLARPGVIAFYAAAMLMQASHGAYYTFFSIHMAASGRSGRVIGSLWALGVVAEMAILVAATRWLDAAPTSSLLTTCFLLAAARWGLYAASTSLLVAIPAQILHAFTYAAFHVAAVTATHRIFPRDLRASGQAVYGGVTYGAGSVIGSLASGALYGWIGPYRLFAVCGLMAMAGAILIGRAARRIPGLDAPA